MCKRWIAVSIFACITVILLLAGGVFLRWKSLSSRQIEVPVASFQEKMMARIKAYNVGRPEKTQLRMTRTYRSSSLKFSTYSIYRTPRSKEKRSASSDLGIIDLHISAKETGEGLLIISSVSTGMKTEWRKGPPHSAADFDAIEIYEVSNRALIDILIPEDQLDSVMKDFEKHVRNIREKGEDEMMWPANIFSAKSPIIVSMESTWDSVATNRVFSFLLRRDLTSYCQFKTLVKYL